MPTIGISPYSRHVQKWKDCTRCPLKEARCQVVHYKGHIPCDVLFIGEAPGKVEDTLGQPFSGPAGLLLDSMITRANLHKARLKLGFTNLVGCIPLDESVDKLPQPPKEAITACRPRLVELVSLCKPTIVVLVGKLAQKEIMGQADFGDCDWLGSGQFISFIHIVHPAAILRMDVTQKGLAIKRCISTLSEIHSAIVPF